MKDLMNEFTEKEHISTSKNLALGLDVKVIENEMNIIVLGLQAEAISREMKRIYAMSEAVANDATKVKLLNNYKHQSALLYYVEKQIASIDYAAYKDYLFRKENEHLPSVIFMRTVESIIPKFVFNWFKSRALKYYLTY